MELEEELLFDEDEVKIDQTEMEILQNLKECGEGELVEEILYIFGICFSFSF
jgi:hypothetical protein